MRIFLLIEMTQLQYYTKEETRGLRAGLYSSLSTVHYRSDSSTSVNIRITCAACWTYQSPTCRYCASLGLRWGLRIFIAVAPVTWCAIRLEKHCIESRLPVKWGSMNTGHCRFLAWGKPFRGHVPAALHNEQGIRPPSCLKTRASRWPFWPFKFKCFKTDPPTLQGSQGSECMLCVCVFVLGEGCWCSLFYTSLFSHFLCSEFFYNFLACILSWAYKRAKD